MSRNLAWSARAEHDRRSMAGPDRGRGTALARAEPVAEASPTGSCPQLRVDVTAPFRVDALGVTGQVARCGPSGCRRITAGRRRPRRGGRARLDPTCRASEARGLDVNRLDEDPVIERPRTLAGCLRRRAERRRLFAPQLPPRR